MADVHGRLVRCFSSVFPTLTETEIRNADVALLMSTDSLTGVTLAALIGEEFGVETDLEELLSLGTFEAINEFLERKSSSSTLP